MNREILIDTLEDIGFDGLPEELQEEIEGLSDKEGETIDQLWMDYLHENYHLPHYLERSLTQVVREHLRRS